MVCPDCGSESPDTLAACGSCGSSSGRLSATGVMTAPLWAQSAAASRDLSPDAPTGAIPVWSSGMMGAGYLFAGRFRIERILGTGGMGAVYKAWDQALGIPVALKVIRPDITANQTIAQESEQRFKQELLLARSVTHRNVIRIHDLGESAGVTFITMQFVEGTDLATLLRAGALPFERTLAFAKQLAAGLQAAHDVGIVHRDLKPQNILIDGTDTLFISDFGLAKSLEATMAGLTRAGELLGTPRYISPEQITGKPADHRSDLYAFGLIMYEMATGGSPFSGESVMDLMFQRVQSPAKDPQLLVPDLPEYFRRVVLRCLERDPDLRYARAADILADLEAARAAPPVVPARTVSFTLPLPHTARWPLVAAAVLVLAIVAAVPIARRSFGTGGDGPTASAVPVQTMRLAVLPFRVAGDQADLAPIAVGVAEALSAKLFGLPGVTVASPAAVQQVRANQPLSEVAGELGATVLISGTVQGTDAGMRVTVTVDDTAAGKRVWAQDFSGVAGDLLTIEDHIYDGLIAALKLTPTSDQLARAVIHPTENLDAYQLYLRGRNAMRGQQDPKNVQAAIEFYEQALQKDAGFALAYAGISDSSMRMYRISRDPQWVQKALASAQQAQRLDDKLVEIHIALASAYQASGKAAEAIAILTTASQLAPGSDDVMRRLGRAYLATGRKQEAIAAYEKAVAINPYYWVSYNVLGAASVQVGDYKRAEAALRKVIELEPDNAQGYNDLGAAYLQMGRYDDSAAALRKSLELQPTAQTYTNLGIAYAYSRKYDAAVPMFEKAVELSPNAEQWAGNLGDGYRWAGQQEKANAAYDKAISLALKALQVNPRDAVVRANLAMYYAKRGDQAQARKLVAAAREINGANVNLTYAQATVEALGGRPNEALASLEEAIRAGYPVTAAVSDPDLQSVVADARFKQFVNRVTAQ